MATSPAPNAHPQGHSLLRLTLMGLLAAIISALIPATTMLALSDYQFYASPHVGEVTGTALQNYAEDLPSALVAAFLWYIPIGTFVFPPVAKLVGANTGSSLARLIKFIVLAAVIWLVVGETIYVVLSPLAPAPPGVQQNDLITAALSGVLFAVI
ncbi:hypothetical protein [Hyphomicrobium sp. 99]|uniref:hypothetical protein n=1 Tax=Hyphomicrobium sp. 99 TaxID=1163419 RepID=UPI0012E0B609|nr:hypothetical protein [Hyphomicrobium sp. 99]